MIPAQHKSAIETPGAPQKNKQGPYGALSNNSKYTSSQKFSNKLLNEEKDDLDDMVDAILNKNSVSLLLILKQNEKNRFEPKI